MRLPARCAFLAVLILAPLSGATAMAYQPAAPFRLVCMVLVALGAAPAQPGPATEEAGPRKRLDLAGEWAVAGVKVFEGDVPQRPKDWKLGTLPASVKVPGPLPFDEGFRGWVTLKREVTWKRDGDLQPRLIRVDGASDSARVRVDGAEAGETAPVEDLAVLTHWAEFHCPFKGPENEGKRMLLMAGGSEYPWVAPLAKALPAEGKAEVEITLRATSGGVLGRPKPPYGILNGVCLEMASPVYIRSVSFDTEKPARESATVGSPDRARLDKPAVAHRVPRAEQPRRFRFSLVIANETGKAFKGKLRAVYGCYQGALPYTGPCPAQATGDQEIALPPGHSAVEVVRDEVPRFATCRATFLLLGRRDAPLDAATQDFQTMAVEIRDRRDFYLNNERFLVKGQGSWGEDAATRLQLRVRGGNCFRGHRDIPSWRVPGLRSEAANIDDRYKDGLLTSAGSALLASCEKCTFWNPKDTSNILKAVKGIIRRLAQCPGILQWEATNELFGEPDEARVAILDAFHKYDPYHRPVLATKSSGEWEAVAHDGRVDGVDIVGCQYLLSKEAVDSIAAAVTEQPIMSTEVNWNDTTLYNERKMYQVWLEKGLCGSLLFDYSGNALSQPVTLAPPEDNPRDWWLAGESVRALYQDLVATAHKQPDGRVQLTVGNRMPYALRGVALFVKDVGRFELGDLAPGDAANVVLPLEHSPALRERLAARAEYVTHSGLRHLELHAPKVAAPNEEKAR